MNMSVIKFIMGNLRKRKSYSIVVCVLVFLAGLIMTVTVSTVKNSNRTFDSAFDRMEGPHLLYGIEEKYFKPEYQTWFENQPGVQTVSVCKAEEIEGSYLEQNGVKIGGSISYAMVEYTPSDKMRLIDSVYPTEKLLSNGEIYLPYVYEASYGFKTGDGSDMSFMNKKIHYKIAGFIEDPLFGNVLSDMKFLFISNAGMTEFLQSGEGNAVTSELMRIRLPGYDDAAANKLRKDFAQICGSDIGFAFTYGELRNANLKLPDIALVVMTLFSAFLCLITITIIRYTILATIEADFLNIGIVKALGFTPLMVRISVTGQYALLASLSGIFSLVAAVYVAPVLERIVLNSSGLSFSGQLSLGASIIILAALILIISVFSLIIAGRTKKISPVGAIASGLAPIHFSPIMNIRLEKIGFVPFNLRMAFKQILTRTKRYVSLLIISIFFIFTLVLLFRFVEVFNSEKALSILGSEFPDIKLTAGARPDAYRLVSDIIKDYDVEWTMFEDTTRLNVEDEVIMVKIRDTYESGGDISTLYGRFPAHDNEAAISNLLISRYGKDIGDYIAITDTNGIKHQFLITGIFQSIDNGGSSVKILESGMKTMDPQFELKTAFIKLKSHDGLDNVISEMKGKYSGFEDISNERSYSESSINMLGSIFSAISAVVFLFTAIIIGFITLLVVKITVYAESKEMGIFKALGFSSAQIRLQLILRFLIITVFGGLIGIALEALFGSQLFSLVLRSAGISSLSLGFNLFNALAPLVAIALIAMLSAFASSGNTKKVSAYGLINE